MRINGNQVESGWIRLNKQRLPFFLNFLFVACPYTYTIQPALKNNQPLIEFKMFSFFLQNCLLRPPSAGAVMMEGEAVWFVGAN